jgi:hypothetical protein
VLVLSFSFYFEIPPLCFCRGVVIQSSISGYDLIEDFDVYCKHLISQFLILLGTMGTDRCKRSKSILWNSAVFGVLLLELTGRSDLLACTAGINILSEPQFDSFVHSKPY